MPKKKGRKRGAKTTRHKRHPARRGSKRSQLPVGYLADGTRTATRREVANPTIPTKSDAALTEVERRELIIQRIVADEFQVAVLGIGVLDRDRAIAAIRSGSRLGRNLEEIERRLIAHETSMNSHP